MKEKKQIKKETILGGALIGVVLVGLLVSVVFPSLFGNKEFIDTTYKFTYAEVKLPSGEIIKGNVDAWRDYENGDHLQITIDGKTYLTGANNVVLTTK